MAYQPVISIATYRRYKYTKQVLQHLAECKGIDKYMVLVNCEPGFPDIADMAKNFPGLKTDVVVHPEKLGCNRNIYFSLERGFAQSDYVIMVEDDILLAKDALEFFEYCRTNYEDNPYVYTVAAYNQFECEPEQHHTLYRLKWFTPWGWATWKSRWEEAGGMKTSWDWEAKRASWDATLNHFLRKDRVEIRPRLGRSQNIGGEMGTWVPNPEWHAIHQLNKHWAGACNIQDGNWLEGPQDAQLLG